MSSEERNINLVVKPGVVATEAALMFDIVYVLAYALQKLEEAMHPVTIFPFVPDIFFFFAK